MSIGSPRKYPDDVSSTEVVISFLVILRGWVLFRDTLLSVVVLAECACDCDCDCDCGADSDADGAPPLLGVVSKLASLWPGLLGGSDSVACVEAVALGRKGISLGYVSLFSCSGTGSGGRRFDRVLVLRGTMGSSETVRGFGLINRAMSITSSNRTRLSHVVIGLMIEALEGLVMVEVMRYVMVPRSNCLRQSSEHKTIVGQKCENRTYIKTAGNVISGKMHLKPKAIDALGEPALAAQDLFVFEQTCKPVAVIAAGPVCSSSYQGRIVFLVCGTWAVWVLVDLRKAMQVDDNVSHINWLHHLYDDLSRHHIARLVFAMRIIGLNVEIGKMSGRRLEGTSNDGEESPPGSVFCPTVGFGCGHMGYRAKESEKGLLAQPHRRRPS
jgi:hypothetical protein